MIRQAELQRAIDLYNEAEKAHAAIRRRLNNGAAIEPGKWTADDQSQADLEWYEENGGIGAVGVKGGSTGTVLAGLDIDLTKHARG